MLGEVAWSLSCALLTFFRGSSIGINSIPPQDAANVDIEVTQYRIPTSQNPIDDGYGPIIVLQASPPSIGEPISQAKRDRWIVHCDSEGRSPEHWCVNLKDGSSDSWWETFVGNGRDDETRTETAPLPHNVTIDLRGVEYVSGIQMVPRPGSDDEQGRIARHRVSLSLDNDTWTLVALGTWYKDSTDKYANFEPQPAQFIRIEALSESREDDTEYISIAELNVYAVNDYTPTAPKLGRWGPTIDFPLVPAGVFVDPISGDVITMSSLAHDHFGPDSSRGYTLTATWNRTIGAEKEVTPLKIEKTGHDMFCPGMSFDAAGRVIITGGDTNRNTSIYDPTKQDWDTGPLMVLQRGYQGQTTCADGSIFVVGGSWSGDGPRGNRDGEIWDPTTPGTEWKFLSNCPMLPMQTTRDWEGYYRADNHVWLLGWKNGTVFQAGPSQEMHWINTSAPGEVRTAGLRGLEGFYDNDAMCGSAAMYDAVKGRILTTGGALQYKYRNDDDEFIFPGVPGKIMGKKATDNSLIVTLGDVDTNATVQMAGGGSMAYNRVFHHSVVLPNGETFVVGGQHEGLGFTDFTAQLVPEIYDPDGNNGAGLWTSVAPHSTPRTYHSFGLLLPDATVLVGGGGLCGHCKFGPVNHFDAQVYTPPYLLTSTGDRANRPNITELSPETVQRGEELRFTTNTSIVSASLIRYSGATHGVNNDQRRIPLDVTSTGTGANEYNTTIPLEAGIAIPGYYMLFAIDAQGVPSEAKTVRIPIKSSYDDDDY